jgi:hypothetical protein
VADVVYLVLAYWPYLAGVFAAGILIGWWAEGRGTGEKAWLEHGGDRP